MVHKNWLFIKTLNYFLKCKNLVGRHVIGIRSYCLSQYIRSGTKHWLHPDKKISVPRLMSKYKNLFFSAAKCIFLLQSAGCFSHSLLYRTKSFHFGISLHFFSKTVTSPHLKSSLNSVILFWFLLLKMCGLFIFLSFCIIPVERGNLFDVHFWW